MRRDAEHLEKAGRNPGPRRPFRALVAQDVPVDHVESLDRRHGGGTLAERQELLGRNRNLAREAAPFAHHDETVRVLVGQGRQENGVDDAEDRRRGANSQCQCQDDDDGESGVLHGAPQGQTQVGHDAFHG